MPERLLVCGSRRWTDRVAIEKAIGSGLEVVIEGEAPGADRLAREIAERRGIAVLPFLAHWRVHGKRAGVLRNRDMLREGRPTRVMAFTDDFGNPHSGTRHMCKIAVEAGIPTWLIRHAEGGPGVLLTRRLTAEDFA